MPEVLNTCLQYFITNPSLQLGFAQKSLGNREVRTAGVIKMSTIFGQVGKRSIGCETTQDDLGNCIFCQPTCSFVDKLQLANECYLQPVPSTH